MDGEDSSGRKELERVQTDRGHEKASVPPVVALI